MVSCNILIVIGIILIIGGFLSIPIPQLRLVFRDLRIAGPAGFVLLILGTILSNTGLC